MSCIEAMGNDASRANSPVHVVPLGEDADTEETAGGLVGHEFRQTQVLSLCPFARPLLLDPFPPGGTANEPRHSSSFGFRDGAKRPHPSSI